MKYASFISAIVLLTACKNTSDLSAKSNDSDTTNTATQIAVNETHCYARNDKDTFWLQITKSGESITGSYTTNIQGKDKNTGTLSGTMRGDTLIADYTFLSEGQYSVRQIAFLRKSDLMIEGFGDVEENNGKMIFKNTSSLSFNEKNSLKEVACDLVR